MVLSGDVYSWGDSRTDRLWMLQMGCSFLLFCCRLSVNQITDSGVKVLYEELTKYKILTFLGYVFLSTKPAIQ